MSTVTLTGIFSPSPLMPIAQHTRYRHLAMLTMLVADEPGQAIGRENQMSKWY
jgi:hypothetical protein